MKYTQEITAAILKDYAEGMTVLELSQKYDAPKRSLITKLGNLGVYKPKEYRNKQGLVPVKKSEYIERLAVLLDVTPDRLDSLEKSNKWILALLEQKLVGKETTYLDPDTSVLDSSLPPRLRVPPPMTSGEIDPHLSPDLRSGDLRSNEIEDLVTSKMGQAQDILDCAGVSDECVGKVSGYVLVDEVPETKVPLGPEKCKWHEEDEKVIPALWQSLRLE